MAAKHTSGPWEVWNGTDVFPVSDLNARKHIADCDPDNAPAGSIARKYEHPRTDMTYGEAMANARLIAAAPEMLDALISADFLLKKLGHSLPNVKDAIAKAEGRSDLLNTTERR